MSSKSVLKLELAFPYEINIIPTVNGGCIVNVGCARLSYSTPARMLTDLKKYLADPEEYEKAFNECNKPPPHSAGLNTMNTAHIESGGHAVEQRPETDQVERELRRDPDAHPEDRQRREDDA